MNRKRIYQSIGIVFLIGMIVSGVMLVFSMQDYAGANKEYRTLREQYVTKSEPKENRKTATSAKIEKETWHEAYPEAPAVDWDGLFKENTDVVAWIDMPAAGISYPVMQADNNSYYLNHSVSGNLHASGSIFLECENSPDFTDANTIIYGHTMQDGTMFTPLNSMSEEELTGCPYIWICLPDKNLAYQVISFRYEKVNGQSFTLFHPEDGAKVTEFTDWIQSAAEQSDTELQMPESYSNRCLTLSTCTGPDKDMRRVIQAILIKEYGT